MEIKEIAQALLTKAIAARASDLFLLPSAKQYLVKIRVPTKTLLIDKLSKQVGEDLISLYKFHAQMDLAERRRPQVGSYTYQSEAGQVRLRLSSLGASDNRESLVIRLIYELGNNHYFFSQQLDEITSILHRRGLFLTSGPTGSGKTSTMYQLAKDLQQDGVVMAIEDPTEVLEPKFLQTQVNFAANISYESLLKAALRNRPDILIVGEIRDSQTAHLAVDAALSGHLTLATVHAKSTKQTISRLQSLGISQSDLLNCLIGVSYQRLMPNKATGAVSCLLDVLSGQDLTACIKEQERGDFASWAKNLQQLMSKQLIDGETYAKYQFG